MGRAVNFVRIKVKGTAITHIKPLSNIKVIRVFPPERIVKYAACRNA